MAADSPEKSGFPKASIGIGPSTDGKLGDPRLRPETGSEQENPLNRADPFVAFVEWAGKIDTVDYADL